MGDGCPSPTCGPCLRTTAAWTPSLTTIGESRQVLLRTRRPSHRCLQYNGTSRSTPWRLQSPHPFSREWALRWLHGRDLQQVGLSRCGTRSMRRASMAAAPQGQLTRSEVDDCLNPYACIIGEWSCVLSWGVSREGQAGARELNSLAFQ